MQKKVISLFQSPIGRWLGLALLMGVLLATLGVHTLTSKKAHAATPAPVKVYLYDGTINSVPGGIIGNVLVDYDTNNDEKCVAPNPASLLYTTFAGNPYFGIYPAKAGTSGCGSLIVNTLPYNQNSPGATFLSIPNNVTSCTVTFFPGGNLKANPTSTCK